MNEETLPGLTLPVPQSVPPIEDRRLLLAIVEASEGLTSLALGTLAASEQLRVDRMGRARVSFDHAVRRLNQILGNELPPPGGPYVTRPLEKQEGSA